ncbi:MAG: TolC family protein [Candidatus Thiodiazotropha sp.]
MKTLLPLILALIPRLAGALDLDEAVALVLVYHPVLAAEASEYAEVERQRTWKADLSLSYHEKGTEHGGPGGANAGVRVSIPLFDRSRDLEVAKARTGVAKARERVLAAFLADVEMLGEQSARVYELATMRRFHRDRLEYRKRQAEEGTIEAGDLWEAAEKVQLADFHHRAEKDRLGIMRERIAREYGGTRWTRLRDLLADTPSS